MSKELEKNSEQLEQVLSGIDVLDNKDTAVFRIDNDTFKLAGIEYKLIENYREAFDMEMMENRFTDYLLKYDYIVGDIAYEKLRLRGFFEDYRKSVPIDMKISNLEDYLVEFCNFGAQYFVFERVEKKKEDPEPYFKPRKHKRSKKSHRSQKQPNKQKQNPKQNQKKKQPKNKNQKQANQTKQKEFQVVKKEQSKQSENKKQSTNRKHTETKKQTQKTQFKIRKKNE